MSGAFIRTFILGITGVTLLVMLGVFVVARQYDYVETGALRGQAEERVRNLTRERRTLNGEYEALRGIPNTMESILHNRSLRHPRAGETIIMERVPEGPKAIKEQP